MLDGSIRSSKEVQKLNIPSLIYVGPSENVTVLRASAFAKIWDPRFTSVEGSVTVSSF